MSELTRDDARQKFKDLSLSYTMIDNFSIGQLIDLITTELSEYTNSGIGEEIAMKLSKPKKTSITYTGRGIEDAFFRVSGSYFKDREAISFNPDGFIGFAGWADEGNVQPFIKAFLRWCDLLHKQQSAN